MKRLYFAGGVSIGLGRTPALVDGHVARHARLTAEIERLWIQEARRRSDEIARGEVQTIPGDEVFARIRERYG